MFKAVYFGFYVTFEYFPCGILIIFLYFTCSVYFYDWFHIVLWAVECIITCMYVCVWVKIHWGEHGAYQNGSFFHLHVRKWEGTYWLWPVGQSCFHSWDQRLGVSLSNGANSLCVSRPIYLRSEQESFWKCVFNLLYLLNPGHCVLSTHLLQSPYLLRKWHFYSMWFYITST